jgi:hypothetical protein
MTLEWRTRKPPTWLGFSGTLARRESLGKPQFVGPWTFWVAVVAMAAAALAGLVTAVRSTRP